LIIKPTYYKHGTDDGTFAGSDESGQKEIIAKIRTNHEKNTSQE
jgi:hypothetical protein